MTHYLRLLIFLLLLPLAPAFAQFPPQAGLPGTTAMHRDSTAFVAWGSNCSIQRGWMDIADTTLGKVTSGDSSLAIGNPDGNLVSLGDGGEAIYYFENPIADAPGYDFAIFENGFPDPADSNMAYLELASVSVSNDGVNYVTFKSTCNIDTVSQVPGFGVYSDARLLDNLAGKYINGFGTPFDLHEFAVLSSIDISNIRYVKIKDVVGSLDEATCARDQFSQKINDPYPTPFATGGFDLDAIGIIHQKYPNALPGITLHSPPVVYPNPGNGVIHLLHGSEVQRIDLYSMQGQHLLSSEAMAPGIDIRHLPAGHYMLRLTMNNGKASYQTISKHD